MLSDVIIFSAYGLLSFVAIALLIFVLFQRSTLTRSFSLITVIILGFVVTVIQAIPEDMLAINFLTKELMLWLALIAVMIAFGGMVLHDSLKEQQLGRTRGLWLLLSALWLLGFLGAYFVEPNIVGWWFWSDNSASITTYVAFIGTILYTLFILGVSLKVFISAPMPEIANRGSFWAVTSLIFLTSLALISSNFVPLMLMGTVSLMLGVGMSIYGIRNVRLGDMRRVIISALRSVLAVFMAWAMIFGILYFLGISQLRERFDIGSDVNSIITLAIVASAIAILIMALRQGISVVFERFLMRPRRSIAQSSAQYSQRVASAANLEDVVEATTESINQIMGVSRSALILVNNTRRVQDAVELIVLEHGATLSNPSRVGYLSYKSPIYHILAVRQLPIGQYDIEYGAIFEKIASAEKQFFRDLQMSIYIPVIMENHLIGLIASGRKLDDTPYRREDTVILSIIGQQVGTALRSTRLIDDLQHLNDSMRGLNQRLENAKVELEKLDTIKTDFVTIASHELRTPLAQIRGYTDIIDSLNDSNALQPEQATQLIGNLRKSTERMEELISAMLDVSQIDVNSLDLRFVRTVPETIIKMALDPLRDPAKERNITINHHSMKNLPRINADLQRMVQAMRNILLNAIKFTPDGGRIDISATSESYEDGNNSDHILFQVRDTGVGVAEKDMPYIFNKFYRGFDTQLHSTGIYKFMGAGPGLGLTIAKGIIEGHGGYIWVESEGHSMEDLPGSIFYVRLPIDPPAGTGRMKPFEGDVNSTQAIPDAPELFAD